MYALAESLHKGVWELHDMPASEYNGWMLFHAERVRQREVEKGNLMAMTEEEMIGNLTGERSA